MGSVPTDPPSSVLILHGWQNRRPPGHWQQLLADELSARGITVRYPQLPNPDMPDRAGWRAAVADENTGLAGAHRVVVAHSLAIWLVLDLLLETGCRDVGRILLVAPVARSVLAANSPIAAFDRGHNDRRLRAAIIAHRGVHVVCSDDDPYWPGGAAGWGTDLGATVHPLIGQGHLALDDGYGSWPGVQDWVLVGGRIHARDHRARD